MHARRCLICLLIVWLGGFVGLARAGSSTQPAQQPGVQQFGAGPLHLYLKPGERPALMFTTPCMQIAQLDGGNGPLAAVREFLAKGMIEGNKLLPVDLQPICM